MPNPIVPSPVLKARGYLFPFTKDYGNHMFAPLGGAYSSLNQMAEAFAAKAEEIEKDRNLSPIGKGEALRSFVKGPGLAVFQAAAAAFQHAETEIGKLKAKAKAKPVDKTDAAGAILRSEMRAWLRKMDPAERTAMLLAPEGLDPQIALAINEAPHQLSGVTAEQRENLQHQALVAEHPEEAKLIQDIAEGADELRGAMRAAVNMVREVTNIPMNELWEHLGGRQKFQEMTADYKLPMAEAAE